MLPNVSIRLFSVAGAPFSSLRTVFSVLPILLWGHAALSGKGACPAGLFNKWRWNLIAKIPSQGHSFVIQEICGFERRSWKGCPDGLGQSFSSQHNSISATPPVSRTREKQQKTQQRNSATNCEETRAETETLCWWERNTRACVVGESQRMVWHQWRMGWVCWMNYFPLRVCLLYLEDCPSPCSSQERALLF